MLKDITAHVPVNLFHAKK